MKGFLVISKGLFHPDIISRIRLRRTLKSFSNEQELDFTTSIEDLGGIDSERYHTVVLFFHEKHISEKSLQSLLNFVRNGGSLFCIHGALASFKTYADYTGLTGGTFTGHDKIKYFHVTGDESFTIKDELYGFDLAEDCLVILESDGIPVFWTRKEGKGLVYCLSPGHRPATFLYDGFRKVIEAIMTECIINGEMNEEN